MLRHTTGPQASNRHDLAQASSTRHLITARRSCRYGVGLLYSSFKAQYRQEAICRAAQPRFDLSLAVPLAGAAFDAYSPPESALGSLTHAAAGTSVTCLDKSFLTEAFQGVLEVAVLRAAGLRDADTLDKSDPYAVLTVGGCAFRTPTLANTLNPVWDDKAPPIKMPVGDPVNGVIAVQLYDEDKYSTDEDLGQASLPLSELRTKGQQDITLPLQGKGAAAGSTVTLRCRLRTWADVAAGEVSELTATNTHDTAVQAVAGLKAAAALLAAEQAAGNSSTASDAEASAAATATAAAAATAGQAAAAAAAKVAAISESAQWRDLAVQLGGDAAEELVALAFVDGTSTDTQAWIHRNKETRTVVISFRGTETSQLKDIISDVRLAPVSPKILKPLDPEVKVHKGFLLSYESVRGTIAALLKAVTQPAAVNGSSTSNGSPSPSSTEAQSPSSAAPWRILVTGHSLGGALATLAAYDLKLCDPSRDITCYTYGGPRVGNGAFVAEYNRLVPNTFRVTNIYDVVVSVPRLFGYSHVGQPVQPAGENGALKVVEPSQELSFEAKMAKGPNFAVSQHMGLNYLATFQQALRAVLPQQATQQGKEEAGKKEGVLQAV